MNLVRVITVFDRNGDDSQKDEVVLKDFSLDEVQKLFGVSEDNPMYDCYEITENERGYFEKKTGKHLDLKKYIYYLECYSS